MHGILLSKVINKEISVLCFAVETFYSETLTLQNHDASTINEDKCVKVSLLSYISAHDKSADSVLVIVPCIAIVPALHGIITESLSVNF